MAAPPEIPELHIDPDMPRPAAKGSGRGLIVPSKTSVVREVDLPGGRSLQIRHGDLTKEDVEVLVNPANDLLQHGSGVSGTIVRNGGRKIKKESDDWIAAHGRVPPGQVAVTSGGNLSCKSIVHAVGPNWTDNGTQTEVNEFMSALRLSFAAAAEKKATSIAVPTLSIANGFPKNLAAALTMQAALEHWQNDPATTVKHVRFTNYDLETVAVYKDEFDRRAKDNFAANPLPANYKELLPLLPTPKESDILGDDDVSDMLEQIALSRAASGKEEKK